MKVLIRFSLLLGLLIFTITQFAHSQTIDLGIYSWSSPKSKGPLTDNEVVKFVIENYGTESISSFTVGFSQDGGNTFKEETVNYTIASGAKYTYTFTSNYAVVGTDGATYEIIGKVTVDLDENSSNDQHTETVINYLIGDVGSEPFEITSFPYSDTREYALYNHNYTGTKYSAYNYLQYEDIVYTFTTTETQMYVDATVHANWDVVGPYPDPSVHLLNKTPDYYSTMTNLNYGIGDYDAVMENAYCYYTQTYYLVIGKGTEYSFPYELEVNLYRQHDFKYFNFDNLSVDGDIDYTNRIVTLTVPQETDITSLTPNFDLPANTEVLVNDVTQESGVTSVDFTNDVTYTINQTISPNTTQTWTIKVVKSTATDIINAKLKNIDIAPNPANDIIKISDNNIDILEVTILNTSGKIVLQQSNINTDGVISVSNLKSGLYFLQINTQEGLAVKKFIKK